MEKSWEAVTDWVGNGFEFGYGNWFGYVTFGEELFVGSLRRGTGSLSVRHQGMDL
jgi:hypothetical protein